MDGNTCLQAAAVFDENITAKPRGPLAQALKQLEEERALRITCAEQLEQAASLRCGLMDSDSRRADVQRQIQTAIASVAKRLRGVE